MRIVLASASPRRKELLGIIVKEFEVMTSCVDEREIEERIIREAGDENQILADDEETNRSTCESDSKASMLSIAKRLTAELSNAKACDIYERLTRQAASDGNANSCTDHVCRVCVIGADTCVVTKDRILGKPQDREDAVRMLEELSMGMHYVVTGVSIVFDGEVKVFTDVSSVFFNKLDDYQRRLIDRYVMTGEPYDKAGAYGIQGQGSKLIERIDGDYFSIMGFPVNKAARVLEELGVMGKGCGKSTQRE